MSKEWKGNSDSVRSRLGINKQHTTKGREEDDFYATDPQALETLLQHCSYWLHNQLCLTKRAEIGKLLSYIPGYIWECACGNGNLAELLIKHNYNVYASDLKNRGYGRRNLDFLQTQECHGEIILTNPPYSLATEFIEHALKLLPDGGLYIALMNISYLAGQKRYKEIYSGGGITRGLYFQ